MSSKPIFLFAEYTTKSVLFQHESFFVEIRLERLRVMVKRNGTIIPSHSWQLEGSGLFHPKHLINGDELWWALMYFALSSESWNFEVEDAWL